MNQYTYWEDNQFIGGEPYDKLFDCVTAHTCRVEFEILQVVFENGQSISLLNQGAPEN